MTLVLERSVPAGPATRRKVPVQPILAAILLLAVLVMAVFAPVLEPYNPLGQNLNDVLAKPNSSHLLGTDSLGRDVLSMLIAGSWRALVGPAVIAIASAVVGNVLGLWSGYKGGRVDTVMMRWVDLMWALPALLVLIVTESAIGGGYWLAVILLTVLTIPFDTRVIRGATLEQTPRPYVEAARSLGVSNRRIMFQHIWPNIAPIAVANVGLVLATSLLALSSLSFLGLGVGPETPDWGVMVFSGQATLIGNPVAALSPAFMIVLAAAAMNVLGDWTYESLSSRGVGR